MVSFGFFCNKYFRKYPIKIFDNTFEYIIKPIISNSNLTICLRETSYSYSSKIVTIPMNNTINPQWIGEEFGIALS